MFVLMKSRSSLNLGHVGSKSRSLGQILEKSCVHSRGHIFGPIILKLCQDVCLDSLTDPIESGSCWVKNQVTRSNLRKNIVYTLGATSLIQSSWKLVSMIVLIKSRSRTNLGHFGSKSRSVGQINRKPCKHCRGHILSLELMKTGQYNCRDEISVMIESRSHGVKK